MYLYALLRASPADIHCPEGITTQVKLLNVGQISAVIEPDVALDSFEQDDQQLLQAILAHDQVIRELFAQTTVLPLRFGTCFESSASLLAHLAASQMTYLAALDQLEGKVEFTLKLTRQEPPELDLPPDLRGKDYFLAKKQQHQQQQAFQAQQRQELEQIIAVVAPLAVERSFQPSHTATEAIYLLIPATALEEFQHSLSKLQQQYTLWQFSLSEALPPYHFIEQFLSPTSAEMR